MMPVVEPEEARLRSITSKDFLEAFGKVKWTPTRRKMLEVHLRSRDCTLSAGDMARDMGWKSHGTANANYGKLAGIICENLSISCSAVFYNLSVLVTMTQPGPEEEGEVMWTLRPAAVPAFTLYGQG